ncbi:MAG: hypothetical protein K8H88_26720, partial [Sandaracinaceae bacterium]|nr:hypothetical protein [Sandaracinaceae bacterium]
MVRPHCERRHRTRSADRGVVGPTQPHTKPAAHHTPCFGGVPGRRIDERLASLLPVCLGRHGGNGARPDSARSRRDGEALRRHRSADARVGGGSHLRGGSRHQRDGRVRRHGASFNSRSDRHLPSATLPSHDEPCDCHPACVPRRGRERVPPPVQLPLCLRVSHGLRWLCVHPRGWQSTLLLGNVGCARFRTDRQPRGPERGRVRPGQLQLPDSQRGREPRRHQRARLFELAEQHLLCGGLRTVHTRASRALPGHQPRGSAVSGGPCPRRHRARSWPRERALPDEPALQRGSRASDRLLPSRALGPSPLRYLGASNLGRAGRQLQRDRGRPARPRVPLLHSHSDLHTLRRAAVLRPHTQLRSRHGVPLVAVVLAACSSAPIAPADSAAPHDGGHRVDSSPDDGGVEVTADGSVRSDAGLPDGSSDAGPVCTCEPTGDCELATCDSGLCVRTPVTDGTLCAIGICVSGSCVPRACGDGYREPGPDPAREACDDGNALDGDACNASCVPTPLVAGARSGEQAWPLGPAPSVAVDGLGNVLVVFRVSDPTGGSIVAASRLSPAGVLLDPLNTPIELGGYAGAGRVHYASVAGLSGGGWAVAYDELDGDGNEMGIVVRLVRPDGTVSSRIVANEVRGFDQTRPVVAAYLDGFVVAWSDYSDAPMPVSRVRLRRFDAMGRPLTGDLLVSPDRLQQNGPAQLAASGDTLAVAFYHPAPEVNDSPAVHLRRLSGTAFVDATDMVLIPARAFDPALAPLASG